jgi:hypothetical protein
MGEKRKVLRNSRGHFLPNTASGPGRSPSGRVTLNELRKTNATATKEVFAKLQTAALDGCLESQKTVLKYMLPTNQTETYVPEAAVALLGLPPDLRLAGIAELSLSGKIPVEVAGALSRLAQQEIDSKFITKLRELSRRIEQMPEGQSLEFVLDTLEDLPLGETVTIIDATPTKVN